MEKFKNNTMKLCSFYVSDWHLATMILPYINKELNEKAKIITILEDDIESNIKTLLSKLNLKKEEEILQIDWRKNESIKYLEILQKFNNLSNEGTNIVIVNGSKTYIDLVNKNINKIINKNTKKIKIINCYEVTEFNNSIKEILDAHDKILNTSGEKEIGEVFEGYSNLEEIVNN